MLFWTLTNDENLRVITSDVDYERLSVWGFVVSGLMDRQFWIFLNLKLVLSRRSLFIFDDKLVKKFKSYALFWFRYFQS